MYWNRISDVLIALDTRPIYTSRLFSIQKLSSIYTCITNNASKETFDRYKPLKIMILLANEKCVILYSK